MTGSRVGLDQTPAEARRIQAQIAASKLGAIFDVMNDPSGFEIEVTECPPWLGGLEGPTHETTNKDAAEPA